MKIELTGVGTPISKKELLQLIKETIAFDVKIGNYSRLSDYKDL